MHGKVIAAGFFLLLLLILSSCGGGGGSSDGTASGPPPSQLEAADAWRDREFTCESGVPFRPAGEPVNPTEMVALLNSHPDRPHYGGAPSLQIPSSCAVFQAGHAACAGLAVWAYAQLRFADRWSDRDLNLLWLDRTDTDEVDHMVLAVGSGTVIDFQHGAYTSYNRAAFFRDNPVRRRCSFNLFT